MNALASVVVLIVAAVGIPLGASARSVGSASVGAPAPAKQMIADPASGMAGDMVQLTGTACVPPNASVGIAFFLHPPSGSSTLGALVTTVTADASGSFVVTVPVPQALHHIDHPLYGGLVTAGDYEWVAFEPGGSDAQPCVAPFEVTAAVTLALSASPASGAPGSTVHVSGSCIQPESLTVAVHAEIDGVPVPGTAAADFVSTGTSDTSLDLWAADVTLPADLVPGMVVSLVGNCTGVAYLAATFTIVEPTVTPPASPAPAVASQPSLTG